MNPLEIDGVVIPKVKGITPYREKIWSKNAGRASDGSFKGDVVARKWKLQVTCSTFTDEEATIVSNAIEPATVKVKFRSPKTGKITEIEAYGGSTTYPVYSYVNGLPRYNGTAFDLIEV